MEQVVANLAKDVGANVRNSLKKIWEEVKDNGIAPLYNWSEYWGGARPVKLRVHNDTGKVELGYKWDNSTPSDEYYGEVRVVYLPAFLTRDAVRKLFLEDEKFIQHIINMALGNTSWEDEQDLEEYLGKLSDNESVNVTTPGEWLEPAVNDYEEFCKFWPPTKSLGDAAEQIYEEAEREGYVFEGGTVADELKRTLYMFDCEILKGVHREEADC